MGMVALHSTLMLIGAQKDFVKNLTVYNKNSLDLHADYYDFSDSFHRFIGGDASVKPSVVIDKFAILYPLFKAKCIESSSYLSSICSYEFCDVINI